MLCAVVFFGAVLAHADTIVLKNGRRIVANNVREEGDKVKYETSAGELSLPKSIVDHIEKGGSVPMGDSPAAAAANLAITPPAMGAISGGTEIESGAVHDGAIDREYIAKLEAAAHTGDQRANASAALAHHAAAQFELSRGDMERALADERTALTYSPEEPALLMNVAYLHLRRSEYKQSLDYLERARRVAPDNADVAKLAGWAYYGMNKMDQAVAEWKRALALRPDPEVQTALDKAQRDKQEEESYKENESSHFTLRYSGAAAPTLAREVLHTLGGAFFCDRVRAEFCAAGFHWRGAIYAAGFCRHHPRAGMGGRAERWAHSRAGAGIERRDSRAVAGAETRADAQFCGAENAWPRANLDTGRFGAMDGRKTQRR